MHGGLAPLRLNGVGSVCECVLGPRRWKQLPGRLVHDLRRSAVRNLIAAGVDEKTAMAVTGHVTAQRVRSLPHRVRGGRGGSDGESRSALALRPNIPRRCLNRRPPTTVRPASRTSYGRGSFICPSSAACVSAVNIAASITAPRTFGRSRIAIPASGVRNKCLGATTRPLATSRCACLPPGRQPHAIQRRGPRHLVPRGGQ